MIIVVTGDICEMFSCFRFESYYLEKWSILEALLKRNDIVSTYNGESLHSSEPGDKSQDDLRDESYLGDGNEEDA